MKKRKRKIRLPKLYDSELGEIPANRKSADRKIANMMKLLGIKDDDVLSPYPLRENKK